MYDEFYTDPYEQMIFDSFPTTDRAEAFVAFLAGRYGMLARLCPDRASMEAGPLADVFPFPLTTPIVLVERATIEIERGIEREVETFGGAFAGT